ncbi:MAG: conjugal transfer protein TrbL, partial [Nocardiopsis sp. BM-2018]
MTFLLLSGFILLPLTGAQANPAICPGNPAPTPEAAGSGVDGLLVPPQSQSSIEGSAEGLPADASMYGQYGVAGSQWHVITESCLDAMSTGAQAALSNTAWDLSKTINQSTITVYQAATSDGLLSELTDRVSSVVVALREGVWRPLIPTMVILGAIWLGWYGLIRKRMTLTIESAVWMVAATALGMWMLVFPSQLMGMANTLVNSGTQLVTSTVGQLPYAAGVGSCPAGAQEPERASWESESDFQVRRNADMLWSSLVCQPWVAGQFGSDERGEHVARRHGVEVMESQAISRIEQHEVLNDDAATAALIEEKQENYQEVASRIETSYPSVYPTFSGQDQGQRFATAILALVVSITAGGLIFASSVALIVFKVAFLFLFFLSPVFLLIGIHPGYGRSVLIRWFELMLGLLLKQIFIVLMISLFVLSFGVVMGTGLGWGLQMLLLSMITLAMFIYRKPFAHLFASVNANTFTSRVISDAAQSQAVGRSAAVLPPVAYVKAQNWGRRRGTQIAAGAAGVPANGNVPAGAIEGAEEIPRADGARVRGTAGYGRVRGNDNAPPLNVNRTGGPGAARPTSGPRSSDQAP